MSIPHYAKQPTPFAIFCPVSVSVNQQEEG
jgi:hypothetical protein